MEPQREELLVGYEHLGVSAFLLRGLFSEAECDFVLDSTLGGAAPAGEAPDTLRSGLSDAQQRQFRDFGPVKRTVKREEHNRKERLLFGSDALAEALWQRLAPFLKDSVGDGVAVFPDRDTECAPGSGLAQTSIGACDRRAPSARLELGDLALPADFVGEWRPHFCNPKFEVMAYPEGGCFRPHVDANLLYRERLQELSDEFPDFQEEHHDVERLTCRSFYTIVVYLTGRNDEEDTQAFTGGETNLLANSSAEQLMYTNEAGEFEAGRKRIFASVVPERGAALVFYQKGLLHEGADIARAVPTRSGQKVILRSDVFFRRTGDGEGRRGPEQPTTGVFSDGDRAAAERWLAESEDYEVMGDYETAAELYEKAMAVLGPCGRS